MKTLLFFILSTFSYLSFAQNDMLYFEKDSYELNAESIAKLDEVIVYLHEDKNMGEIALIGHTDTDADEKYNSKLALNRAHAVKDYLSERKIYNRFHLLSKGEFNPVNENSGEEQKRVNRRVEVVLNYQLNNYALSKFEQERQEFKISPYDSSSIITKYGTKINFGQDIFDSVLPHLSIRIHVQEFYDKANFVLANLTTETVDNKRLESKGMINIQAIQNGDTLKLKKGESFDILFPDREIGDEMQLFEGLEHDDEISWDQTTFRPSRSFLGSGWSTRYYKGGDTISKSKWWFETIQGETFRIKRMEDLVRDKVTMDTTDVANEELISELMMASTNMGWINCDRFTDENSPKEDLIVEFNGDFVPTVSIVFNDINSVLPYSYREDNKLIFQNIPINRDITIIGLHSEINSDKILFASQKSRSRKGLKEFLRFEQKEEEEIKLQLTQL